MSGNRHARGVRGEQRAGEGQGSSSSSSSLPRLLQTAMSTPLVSSHNSDGPSATGRSKKRSLRVAARDPCMISFAKIATTALMCCALNCWKCVRETWWCLFLRRKRARDERGKLHETTVDQQLSYKVEFLCITTYLPTYYVPSGFEKSKTMVKSEFEG